MLRHLTAFSKGAIILVLWIAWFAAGALFASSHGDIRDYLNGMPQEVKLFFYAWLFVSTSLLYYAVFFLFKAFLKRAPRPPA